MARLIDADALEDSLGISDMDIYAKESIREAPTIDAVPVVRCKDCKHWRPGDSFGGDSLDDMQRIGGCPIVRFCRRENDFCCDGERRT